jgi:hypothetical protein
LEIIRRSLEADPSPVTVTLPSGKKKTLQLTDIGGGRSRAVLPVSRAGLYRVNDGKRSAVAAAGALNALEMAQVRATGEKLRPVAASSGGAMVWLAEQPRPAIRSVRPGRLTAGRGGLKRTTWLGFRANRDYVVTGIREVPLLPAILVLLLGLGALLWAWRREGK